MPSPYNFPLHENSNFSVFHLCLGMCAYLHIYVLITDCQDNEPNQDCGEFFMELTDSQLCSFDDELVMDQ